MNGESCLGKSFDEAFAMIAENPAKVGRSLDGDFSLTEAPQELELTFARGGVEAVYNPRVWFDIEVTKP